MPVTAQVKFTIWLWHLCTIRCNPGRDFSQLHGSSVWLCYIPIEYPFIMKRSAAPSNAACQAMVTLFSPPQTPVPASDSLGLGCLGKLSN